MFSRHVLRATPRCFTRYTSPVRAAARELRLGSTELAWDGKRTDGVAAGSGVYFIRLRTVSAQAVIKVVLVR